MCKSVRGSLEDQRWIRIRIMDPVQRSYMDPMWGRSGPSMDPYKDPIWMPMSGSSGPVAGGHGSVETEKGAIA